MPRASYISVPNTIGDRGTLAPEAAPAWPKGNFEAMARRRYQDPEPVRSGNWWYLLFWQEVLVCGKIVRKRKRPELAPADLPEREAKREAAKFLQPMNQGLTPIGSAMKFEQYVDTIYNTTLLPLLAKSTQERYSSVIKNYLKPAFG